MWSTPLSRALTYNMALYKLFLKNNIVSALQYKAPRLKGQITGSGYGQGRTMSETTAVMADQGYGRSSDRSGVYDGVNLVEASHSTGSLTINRCPASTLTHWWINCERSQGFYVPSTKGSSLTQLVSFIYMSNVFGHSCIIYIFVLTKTLSTTVCR